MGAIHGDNFTDALYKVLPFRWYMRNDIVKYSDDATERQYTIWSHVTDTRIATLRARPLPGCCGVLCVYYLRPNTKRVLSTFKRIARLVVTAAGLSKYGAVLFTQGVGSIGQKALAANANASFVNWKTDNRIEVFVLLTKQPKQPKKSPQVVEE